MLSIGRIVKTAKFHGLQATSAFGICSSTVTLQRLQSASKGLREQSAAMAGKRGLGSDDQNLHNYLVSKSYRGNAALDGLQKASLKHKRGIMVSPPDSIPILQLLLKLTNAKKVVEVGVFTGYTSLGMALGLPDGGRLYALDIADEYPSIGKPYWEQAGVADKIELMIGPATDSLHDLLERLGPHSVDMGFIDADKDNYDAYYELLLKLVRPGGVIVVDNVLWDGAVIDPSDETSGTKAIRALNEKIHQDERVLPAMLKNSDGITVAYKL